MRSAFVVNDHGCGLIKDAQAILTKAERQIGVFAIGRGEGLIEASEPIPNSSRHKYRDTRDIIGVSNVIEFRFVGSSSRP